MRKQDKDSDNIEKWLAIMNAVEQYDENKEEVETGRM
jgi:hypothetical protein